MDIISDICKEYDLQLIMDGCDSLGSKYKQRLIVVGFGVTHFIHHITLLLVGWNGM